MRLHHSCSLMQSHSIYPILLQILSSPHFFSLTPIPLNLQLLQQYSNKSTPSFSKSWINNLLSCKLNISSYKVCRKLKMFSKLRFSCLTRTIFVSHSATSVLQAISLILIKLNWPLSLKKRTSVKTLLQLRLMIKRRKRA